MKKKTAVFWVILLLAVCPLLIASVQDYLWHDNGDGSISPQSGKSVAMPTTDSGVTVYGDAKASVTIDPTVATEHVVNLTGSEASTGVSIFVLTPTQSANMRRTITIVTHGTGTPNFANPASDIQFASGTSPTPTSGTTNIMTATYNNVTKRWRVVDGPYDMRGN